MWQSIAGTQSNLLSTLFWGIIDQVLAVDRTVIERAKQIVLGYQRLSARDAVHLSVMEQCKGWSKTRPQRRSNGSPEGQVGDRGLSGSRSSISLPVVRLVCEII